MSNHKNLFFFNKEGDYLNFKYNEADERFEGDILFHENSTDTFKTSAIYTLENIPSFEFEVPGELTAKRFQLFNEYGFHFYGSKNIDQKVVKIEPVNNDPGFYTKWIYGDGFERKFPVGTLIKFDYPNLEFTNLNQVYTVVSAGPGKIMILSLMDNATFEAQYQPIYLEPDFYQNITISGVNAFGVYDYRDSNYYPNLQLWNERDFANEYYVGRKLNVIGSEQNDEILTVDNPNYNDLSHFEYNLKRTQLPQDSTLIMEVLTRTDVPLVYQGPMTLTQSKILIGDLYKYPQTLKPGMEFKVIGSIIPGNDNFVTVDSILDFRSITSTTYFNFGSQVLWNGKIYECISAYTQSISNLTTSNITPDNESYWSNPTYVKVTSNFIHEDLLSAQLYLTNDRYYYTWGWTHSAETTLASFAEKYKSDLEIFNIDLYYSNKKLSADLKYPTKYGIVNFYYNEVGPSYSIGSTKQTVERIVGVKQELNYELNYNYSVNKRVGIVFTDLDDYGIKIKINGQIYDEETVLIYSGGYLDMERTIDRTIRNWLARYYLDLIALGIVVELKYTGSFTSVFYNSIVVKSEFPNVDVKLEDIQVGETAFYYVEHSKVTFTDMGSYLNINIDGNDYGIQSITGTNSFPDISQTLAAWEESHSDLIAASHSVQVKAYNTILKFDLLDPGARLSANQLNLDYTIKTGKLNIPGLQDYTIQNYMSGNHGVLVASNEVLLPTSSTFSFEDAGFATGMAFTINNTFYTYVNQDFVIQNLDTHSLNLSYQGPFWGLTGNPCLASPFQTSAFDIGYGATACVVPVTPTQSILGPFYAPMFGPMFSAYLSTFNVYTTNFYDGYSGLVDIEYIQLTNGIYGFGDDLVAIDAYFGTVIGTVSLPGNTQSIEMEFNPVNNYIYCLSKKKLFIVDPTSNSLISSFTFSNLSYNAFDLEVNPINGDVYITYDNSPRIDIWSYDNISFGSSVTINTSTTNFPPLATRTGAMVFNDFEGDMYVTTGGHPSGQDVVLRINGGITQTFPLNSNRDIQTTYGVYGLTNNLFYDPVYESIYVYGSASLYKIDNDNLSQISGISSYPFVDMVFNNIKTQMNISDSSTSFKILDVGTDNFTQVGIGHYGYQSISQFDGDIYLSSQSLNAIVVISSDTGQIKHTEPFTHQTGKIVYNPERKSVWTIQPGLNRFVEMEVEINQSVSQIANTFSEVGDNLYGTLDPNYKPRESVWLKTRDYFRRPRENFEGDVPVKFYWKWLSDEVPEFFLYDFSGEQLEKTGPFAYSGVKPLSNIVLNRKPNRDRAKNSFAEYQQTVFDNIEYTLSYIDDSDDVSVEAQSLELFVGFRSENEGALRSVLQLYKKEEIEFEIVSSNSTDITFETLDPDGDKRGRITINELSSETFTGRGLKPGQHIVIYIKDTANKFGQYVSENNGLIVKIRSVFTKILIVDYFSPAYDYLANENTKLTDYPKSGNTTYLKTTFKVRDREIGRFITYGQTEDEDIRYKIELNNIGKLISPNEVFIFKEYDINEGGIDWTYLNKKRKEMLMNKDVIYPYVGSYKSIINAINYFGYNDLQLNEYYRNVEILKDSEGRVMGKGPNYGKKFKIEIPDIFDNTIKGWSERDYLTSDYLTSDKYVGDNSFNLTYFITDKEGNYILNYSLDEIVIKLQGLKYWLKRNIIPLTHKILDITGNTWISGETTIKHNVYDCRIFNLKEDMTPVTFKMNEVYLSPVNSGSTVYNCVLDFYSIIDGLGASMNPYGVTDRYGNKELMSIKNSPVYVPVPKPYYESQDNLVSPDIFDITIKTYKTYKEWAPYVTYDKGDKVIYYDILYESTKDNNRINNPRKYENSLYWVADTNYTVSTVVEYEKDYYVYSGLGTQSNVTPPFDPQNWLKVTEWKRFDYEPVQCIKEQRSGDDLLPFNFTIDSNIDPFISIEVSSHSGYGQCYTDKKNYYLKGIKDITEPYKPIDKIGPFIPITPVY